MNTKYEKIELLEGSAEVERRAYYGNRELTHVAIPEGVTIIRESAFQGCRNLQFVKIPKSVVCIEALAFDCKQLRKQLRNQYSFEEVDLWVPDWSKQVTLEYEGSRDAWDEIYKSIDMGDVQITFGDEHDSDYDMTVEMYHHHVAQKKYCDSSLRTIIIPEGVTKIEKETFYWCCNLISVKIPSTVTEIGASAFAFCRNLREIQIPDSVTTIAEDAFRQCDNLSVIMIPAGVKSIGEGAFKGCTKLQHVVAERQIVAYLPDLPQEAQTVVPPFCYDSQVLIIKENVWEDCDELAALTNAKGDEFHVFGQGSYTFLRSRTLLSKKQAIKINVAPAEKDCDYAHSRFMGSPLIPLSWKEKAEVGTLDLYENDAFWFQVNFVELSWIDGTALPTQGYLYVFLNLKEYPYEIRSYYYDGSEGAPSCVIDGFNEGFEHYGLTQTSYPITFTCCDSCEEGMKLLGNPAMGEYDGKKLFLQYDPLDSPMQFLKEIDGYGYIFMKEDGLTDMDFVIERT